MVKRLLIDAAQSEEMRAALLDNQKLEEFDTETHTKEHLRSNIYLAKVIRIEPALQAAFVDYGAERHGFLPFHEIHRDYYKIPVADREENASDDTQEDAASLVQSESLEAVEADQPSPLPSDEQPETAESKVENADKRQPNKRYKIQEVIKRQQVILVQIVRDERGGKGAALTTYLSLAGRYCVLMPNASARAGGVSKRISDGADRQRLKEIVSGLDVPEQMSLIVRTASSMRTKSEIKRDYDYLIKLWQTIRKKTLESNAPCLVYEEGNLIKRSLRDYNTSEIDEILINDEKHYKDARAFMKLLVPSHVKKIKLYKENAPLLDSFKVEDELEQIFHPRVNLPSGGYLIINITEALIAIDVNSGRAIKERNIEETAVKTNLEAAREVARQLKLRDLAGIIVVDFIDMSEQSNIHKVERLFKEAVSSDRARVQVGRISQFGTLEMSRQRLKPSLVENHSSACPSCNGTGVTRSTSSIALYVLRMLERELASKKSIDGHVSLKTIADVDLYILNKKRQAILVFEQKFGVTIEVTRDISLTDPNYKIEGLVKENTQKKHNNKKSQEPKKREPESQALTKQEEPLEESSPTQEKTKGRKRRPKHHRNNQREKEESGSANNAAQTSANSAPASGMTIRDAQPTSTADASLPTEEIKKKPRRARRSRHKTQKDVEGTTKPLESEQTPKAKPQDEPKISPTPGADQEKDDANSPKPSKKKSWVKRLINAK